MKASKQMQDLVTDLLKRHSDESSTHGMSLTLAQAGRGQLVIEEQIPDTVVNVAYLFCTQEGQAVAEPELDFWVSKGQWIPYTIGRITVGMKIFGEVRADSHQLTLTDVQGQARLAKFTDWFANDLRTQGWLEQSYTVHTGRFGVHPRLSMQVFVETLARQHNVDLGATNAFFHLCLPEYDESLVIQRVGRCVNVARYVRKEGEYVADPDMTFRSSQFDAWRPVNMIYSWTEWQAYVNWSFQHGYAICEEPRESIWMRFANYWSGKLLTQGWLEHSQLCNLRDFPELKLADSKETNGNG